MEKKNFCLKIEKSLKFRIVVPELILKVIMNLLGNLSYTLLLDLISGKKIFVKKIKKLK